MPEDKFYITTAIDYINGKPHIGHAYEKVATDVLARFYRGRGIPTFFLTGTDEHGTKIAKAAETAGQPIEDFARETAATFSFAWDALNVQPDRFIRTTDQDHINAVEEIITTIKNKGYLYEADYEGLYCVGHEAFITEKELVNGLCPEHKIKPEKIKEKNWFFKVSEFVPAIRQKIRNQELKVWPKQAEHEILNMLEDFKDIAVTRPNVKWGIPVPWDKQQTVYVWVDALINYLTGVGYSTNQDQFSKFWPADVHVVGKDISKFHCIIWPAMLLAAELPLPKSVVVHGYLTVDGEKISKSIGNVIDPNDWVAKYGSDAVRYLLLREIPFGQDGDVSEEKLKARYEGDLANGLGNLVSRITTLIEKHFDGKIESKLANPLKESEIDRDISEFKFHEALAKIWQLVITGNKIVDEYKLWELAKTDLESFRNHCEEVILILASTARYLQPLLPETSRKIKDIITAEKITKAQPLFPRIP